MQLDFPFSSFNHEILCVPQGGDTVWLECTSKDLPAGYLSSFTENRNVLMLTPEGGFVVRTPMYDRNNNVLVRNSRITINEKDEVTANIKAMYKGYWWDKERMVLGKGKSEVDNYLNRKFSIPTYNVGEYKVSDIDTRIPQMEEQIALKGNGNITRTGKRMFVSLHLFAQQIEEPTSTAKRNKPFEIFEDYRVSDTVTCVLNGTYHLESTRTTVDLDYPFAKYHCQVSLERDSVLTVTTHYEQHAGIYEPELFANYAQLSKEMTNNALDRKIVLLKKD
jgi:hypothetical protein